MKVIPLPRNGRALLLAVKALRDMPPAARRTTLQWLHELVDSWDQPEAPAAPSDPASIPRPE